jgi:hypothetical protein
MPTSDRRGAPLYGNPGMQRLIAFLEELGPDAYETCRLMTLSGFSFSRAAALMLFNAPMAPERDLQNSKEAALHRREQAMVEQTSQMLRQRVHRIQERVDRMLGGAAGFSARGATRPRVMAGADDRAYEWAAAEEDA